ncbi:asialoglycoprotein receptor 2-like isoform X3 [Hemibagrus wyckioides]|uniref:asialoglycoprotein receptor 2-like isoform X3 n=1 Tax=Hemibagrus wyckioides TaxID=337641 RepID=UPI00266CF11C|nr:asialoglycoprotein receptor 2-like isoform X3 [Hemibagrus wyckioides]
MEQHLFLLLFLTGVVPLVLSDTRQYFLIQQGKTWSDAQAYCQDKYKDLAIIKTSADMVQLQNEAQRQQFTSSAWIGMYNDINGWKWSLGYEPVGSMRLWGIWQPDNWQGKESCGGMNGGTWHDRQCTDQVPFVCFDEVTRKQQIIRLKIQSSQDVNDTAIKETILEQIKNKLKDHGMAENITVKWRD